LAAKPISRIGPGATQCPRTPLGFDEPHRFTFGHRLATVLAVRARQRRGELEPDDLPVDYGGRIHAISVRKDAGRNKCPVPLTQVASPVDRGRTPDRTPPRWRAVDDPSLLSRTGVHVGQVRTKLLDFSTAPLRFQLGDRSFRH
jgi:hypothetical protein